MIHLTLGRLVINVRWWIQGRGTKGAIAPHPVIFNLRECLKVVEVAVRLLSLPPPPRKKGRKKRKGWGGGGSSDTGFITSITFCRFQFQRDPRAPASSCYLTHLYSVYLPAATYSDITHLLFFHRTLLLPLPASVNTITHPSAARWRLLVADWLIDCVDAGLALIPDASVLTGRRQRDASELTTCCCLLFLLLFAADSVLKCLSDYCPQP